MQSDKSRGIAGVCKWSSEYGAHPSLPPAGQFVGSDAQKKLAERKFRNLIWGKNADGTTWTVPKASDDGLLTYKKLLSEEKASTAPCPRPQDGADTRRPDNRGTRDLEIDAHSHLNCVDGLALHECTLSQDNAFNARVNMLISPSQTDAQMRLATSVPATKEIVRTGEGAIAKAARAVATMAAASRAREETLVGGERQVSVLLDTGASGRNFISSKLASWLIERGSTTLTRK